MASSRQNTERIPTEAIARLIEDVKDLNKQLLMLEVEYEKGRISAMKRAFIGSALAVFGVRASDIFHASGGVQVVIGLIGFLNGVVQVGSIALAQNNFEREKFKMGPKVRQALQELEDLRQNLLAEETKEAAPLLKATDAWLKILKDISKRCPYDGVIYPDEHRHAQEISLGQQRIYGISEEEFRRTMRAAGMLLRHER